MKGRLKDLRSMFQKHKRMNIVFGCMALALMLAAVGFNLTKDEAQIVTSDKVEIVEVKAENEGCEEMATNPLKQEKYPEVTQAVQDYYGTLTQETDFVEGYHNVKVYTKEGKYKDSYVAFARYDMKIKDIYTEVPGLGTLYIEKDEKDGKLHVDTAVEDEEIQQIVKKVVSHEDVQVLMAQIQTDYANAIASDAMLKERLEDLQSAYKNSSNDTSDGRSAE